MGMYRGCFMINTKGGKFQFETDVKTYKEVCEQLQSISSMIMQLFNLNDERIDLYATNIYKTEE